MIQTTPNNPLPTKQFSVRLSGVAIAAAGSPIDAASIALPPQVTRWIPTRTTFRAATAAGTLAGASVGVFTQAAGAGTTIVTAAAITSLTAANKMQTMTTIAVTDGITDTNIFIRQTADSANAGTLDIVIDCIDLT